MIAKHFGVAALAAVLLTGTSALAVAQSSQKPSQPSTTDMQKSPSSQSGGMSTDTGKSSESSSPSTTGQSDSGKNAQSAPTKPQAQQNTTNSTKPSDKNAAQGTSQPSGKNAAQGTSQPSGKSAQGAAPTKSSTSGSAPATGSANLNAQQKTVIKNKIIDNKSAPRVSHVDFNVSVGVAVPTSIHLAPLPVEIVHIHPAWKSYVYFVYEEEVIIVNPHTHKIVEIIRVS